MDLSIIIPVYKESTKISHDIEAAAAFLTNQNMTGEIIVVDDGSGDNTADVARQTAVPKTVSLLVLANEKNRGKGYTIRSGMAKSSGSVIMFADSGLCIPYDELLKGYAMIRDGRCEIAHASRKLPDSNIIIPQAWHRRISSRIFRWVLVIYMKMPMQFSDTQCGFKLYAGDIGRSLYQAAFTDGFMFDVEIILRALKKGYRIKEFPVSWRCDRDSRLSVTGNQQQVFAELKKIREAIKSQ